MSLGSIEKCEPNLTPLLDMVLQLIMFFMLCANFLMEDLNAEVKLPTALVAKPLDKAEEYVIFVNLEKSGQVRLGGGVNARPLTNREEVRIHMARKHEFDVARQESARKRGAKEIPRLSLVVLRADADCTFKQVNDVLMACRQAGYRDIQLRAKLR